MNTSTAFDEAATKFLLGLAATGIATDAAKAAGMTHQAFYKRRASDPTFAAAWDDAVRQARSMAVMTLREIGGGLPAVSQHLAQTAARLANPDLAPGDREAILHRVSQLSERVAELRKQADSAQLREHGRRLRRAARELDEALQERADAARELDRALKAVEPALKEARRLQERCEQLGREADTPVPHSNVPLALAAALHFSCPTFGQMLGVRRPPTRALREFAAYLRSPGGRR